jgi:uncharacterized membrane protein
MLLSENSEIVTYTLLKKIGGKVSDITVKNCLNNHPDYPSLLAIRGCLNEWNIDNYGHRINKEEINVNEISTPFIAHVYGKFILVNKIKSDAVLFTDENDKNGKFTIEQFLKRWGGIALHATVNNNSGESNYTLNRIHSVLQSLKFPILLLISAVILFLSLSNQSSNWTLLALTTLKIIGVSLSVLLLIQSSNANNPFIKNLCNLSGNNDCNKILNSDAAKLTSWLSWSEIGFFYFAGSLLTLLLSPSNLFLLKWFNFFALPYTVYSITYQFKVKNWCILCCSVQVILILEAISFFLSKNINSSMLGFNFESISFLLFCFLSPILAWAYIKPLYVSHIEFPSIKNQLKKYKYNNILFNQALKNQPRYSISDELSPIILGNPDAQNVITLVSNPFCGPCSTAHQIVENWLTHNDKIQLRVIFSVKNKEGDDPTKAARHLTSINQLNSPELMEKAVNEWYGMKTNDYENWSKKFPTDFDPKVDAVLQRQREWCDMAEISFTPTVLINGYKLPEPYRLEDIKYFLS